jgi:hypothetical protein
VVLGKIFGPKRDEVTAEWRKLHNEELPRQVLLSNQINENEMGGACGTYGEEEACIQSSGEEALRKTTT